MSGYLQKWTNYLKGYQKRWFVLNDGLLSYYRSQAEMAHTCRGTIKIANAIISSEDACHFVVANLNCGTQTFHLKASSEQEKQRWVSAIEMAKSKARQYGNDSDDDEELATAEQEKNEVHNMLKSLQQKLEELSTCNELVQRHSSALTKSLVDLQENAKPDELTVKTMRERETLYKVTMLAMINTCQEFTVLAMAQGKKMQRLLQSEREMRAKLEDMVQEMAKTQSNIESQISKRSKAVGGQVSASGAGAVAPGKAPLAQQKSHDSHVVTRQELFNENEEVLGGGNEDEFHDALEDVTVVPIAIQHSKVKHRRNESNLSKISLQESDMSSEEEQATTIKVTMTHTNNNSGKEADEAAKQKAVVRRVDTQAQIAMQRMRVRERRKEIPPRPNLSINLWG